MGCDTYEIEDGDGYSHSVRFDWDDNQGCLCVLKTEQRLDTDDIKLLAYLGLAVVMLKHGEFDGVGNMYLPSDLPKDRVKEINDAIRGNSKQERPQFHLRRNTCGCEISIEVDGWDVLHLAPSERNLKFVAAIVDVLNGNLEKFLTAFKSLKEEES